MHLTASRSSNASTVLLYFYDSNCRW